MMTLRKISGLILISLTMGLFLYGCAKVPQLSRAPQPSKAPIAKKPTLSDFNQVVINGQVDVNLSTGHKKPNVMVHGDPNDRGQLTINVTNQVLFVTLPREYPKNGPVSVDIQTNNLHGLTYQGKGQVNGRNIQSTSLEMLIKNSERTKLTGNIYLTKLAVSGAGYTEMQGVRTENLDLSIKDNSKVMLTGMGNFSNLNLNGDGWFGMYWVKSDTLTIKAKGHTTIQLAGVANKLDLELWDYVHFNGRYLRAKRTFAKTHGHSIAGIASVDRQHTLATDASDIYFYNIPTMKTDFMAFNGAVLDMRDWPYNDDEKYDEYNK